MISYYYYPSDLNRTSKNACHTMYCRKKKAIAADSDPVTTVSPDFTIKLYSKTVASFGFQNKRSPQLYKTQLRPGYFTFEVFVLLIWCTFHGVSWDSHNSNSPSFASFSFVTYEYLQFSDWLFAHHHTFWVLIWRFNASMNFLLLLIWRYPLWLFGLGLLLLHSLISKCIIYHIPDSTSCSDHSLLLFCCN